MDKDSIYKIQYKNLIYDLDIAIYRLGKGRYNKEKFIEKIREILRDNTNNTYKIIKDEEVNNG